MNEDGFVKFGIAYNTEIELIPSSNTTIDSDRNIVVPKFSYLDYRKRFFPHFIIFARDVTQDTFRVILEFASELSLELKVPLGEGIEAKV